MFLFTRDLENIEKLLDEALRAKEVEKHGNTGSRD